MTDISVIIPVHNGGVQFRECLTALARSTPPPHELIVVDDGSTDGSADLAAQHGARILRTARPGGGPAVARNLAAQSAAGDVLFFCDADVAVRPDTLARIAAAFGADPDLTALFGSYDDAPSDSGLISQYKNLFHHYVHQHGAEDASTFWSGCGAIRRDAFLAAGGFSPRYRLPSIEDIELGYTLKRAGHRIRLDKALQVKHLKRWTLRSLLHSDIVARGVPWTRLILRERAFLNDLNLQTHNRTSVVVVYLGLLCAALGLLSPAVWIGVPAAALVLLLLNRRLYRFFAARRDARFAAAAAGLHWLYYSYNGISFGVGLVLHVFAGIRDWSLATGNSQIRDPHSEITTPRSPMTTFLPAAIFLVTWLAYLAIIPAVLRTWKITGDEPHYLLAAHSLAFDHDLNLRDNYERRDYAAFYALPFLDRHVAVQPDGSERLTHDIGLPVVIAPAYWLGGRSGVMHLFAIVGALLAVQMFLLGWEVSGHWWAGLAGWLALAFSAPLVNYVFLIYPEALGGLLVIWALRRILDTPAWRPLPTTNLQSSISVGNWRLVIGDWIALPAAVAALPWLSGRFAPLLVLLAALTIWKFRARVWLPIAGAAALSLLVYLLVNYTTYGSPTPSVTVAGPAVGAGFSNVGALQIGRGLAGWLLDQQRGLLVYAPILLLAPAGVVHLWRLRRMDGLLLLSPFAVMWLLVSVWGGFYVAWEISARFLIVGAPLLAAPMAALLGGVGGWRRVMLWPLAAALALFSVVNALVVFVDPFVPYHRSPVAFYEEALHRPLRAYFPALGTRAIAAPDDGAPEWSAAAGQAQYLLHSEGIGLLSIGWYKLYGQAQFGPSADPATAALVFDVSSSEDGRSLLHAQIGPADADDATGVADFAFPYFNPYYNRWDFPFYLDIQTTGATDVRLSPILIEPDPVETNKRVGAWLAGIGLLAVLFAAPAGSWHPRFR